MTFGAPAQAPDPLEVTAVAKMLIGGELVDAKSGKSMEVRNPANGEVVGDVPRGAAADVDAAVRAAHAARHGVWGGLTTDQRYFLCASKAEWEDYYLKNHTRLFHGQLDPAKLDAFRQAFAKFREGDRGS